MISLYMVLELKLYQKIDDIFLICLYQIYINNIRSLFEDNACFINSCMYYTLLYFVFYWQNPPTQPAIKGECILAVNKHGIHFLSLDTHVSLKMLRSVTSHTHYHYHNDITIIIIIIIQNTEDHRSNISDFLYLLNFHLES